MHNERMRAALTSDIVERHVQFLNSAAVLGQMNDGSVAHAGSRPQPQPFQLAAGGADRHEGDGGAPVAMQSQTLEARTALDEGHEASSTIQMSVRVRDLEVSQISAQAADQDQHFVGAVEQETEIEDFEMPESPEN